MEREDTVIELGAATVETKGGNGQLIDVRNDAQLSGIADD